MKKQDGFTLIELAIVLVVIGLLIAGIITGTELILQSKIKNTISKMAEIDRAALSFKGKYRQLPGDMAKASTFGLNAQKDTSAINVAVTAGSNGDGNNNKILESIGASTAYPAGELVNFWAHLGNEKLISNSLGQIPSGGAPIVTANVKTVAGINIPDMSTGIGLYAITEGNKLYYIVGIAGQINGNSAAYGASLAPEIAFGIDSKIDDGLPNAGGTIAINSVTFGNGVESITTPLSGAATNTSCHGFAGMAFSNKSEYNLANENLACTIRVSAPL